MIKSIQIIETMQSRFEHDNCLFFVHPAHHIELPPIYLAIDEALLGAEYSTPSTIEPRQ